MIEFVYLLIIIIYILILHKFICIMLWSIIIIYMKICHNAFEYCTVHNIFYIGIYINLYTLHCIVNSIYKKKLYIYKKASVMHLKFFN